MIEFEVESNVQPHERQELTWNDVRPHLNVYLTPQLTPTATDVRGPKSTPEHLQFLKFNDPETCCQNLGRLCVLN